MQTFSDANAEKPREIRKLYPIYRFFCWCSGARLYILKQCPSDFNKFYGIGVIVFLTGLMASLTGGYALYTVFRSPLIAIGFGLLWGFLIFSIDWYIVASLRKHQKKYKEIGTAVPRFLLAIIVAIVISMPLKMKLFEREIDHQLLFKQQQSTIDYQQLVAKEFDQITTLEEENSKLREEIQKKEDQRNLLFSMFIAEAEGFSPTKTPGKGPVFREKKAEYDKIDQELKQLRDQNMSIILKNSEQLDVLRSQQQVAMQSAQVVNKSSDGFLARIEAMGELSDGSESIRFASWFIILLFIVIESAPIIVKLISARGPYDDLLEAEEYIKQVEIRKIVVQAELTEDHRIDLHRLLEKERNEKLYEVEKDHILSEAKVLSQINKMKIQRWKEEEFNKFTPENTPSSTERPSKFQPDAETHFTDDQPIKHFEPIENIDLKEFTLKDDGSDDDENELFNDEQASLSDTGNDASRLT
jgi:hypothetical protein